MLKNLCFGFALSVAASCFSVNPVLAQPEVVSWGTISPGIDKMFVKTIGKVDNYLIISNNRLRGLVPWPVLQRVDLKTGSATDITHGNVIPVKGGQELIPFEFFITGDKLFATGCITRKRKDVLKIAVTELSPKTGKAEGELKELVDFESEGFDGFPSFYWMPQQQRLVVRCEDKKDNVQLLAYNNNLDLIGGGKFSLDGFKKGMKISFFLEENMIACKDGSMVLTFWDSKSDRAQIVTIKPGSDAKSFANTKIIAADEGIESFGTLNILSEKPGEVTIGAFTETHKKSRQGYCKLVLNTKDQSIVEQNNVIFPDDLQKDMSTLSEAGQKRTKYFGNDANGKTYIVGERYSFSRGTPGPNGTHPMHCYGEVDMLCLDKDGKMEWVKKIKSGGYRPVAENGGSVAVLHTADKIALIVDTGKRGIGEDISTENIKDKDAIVAVTMDLKTQEFTTTPLQFNNELIGSVYPNSGYSDGETLYIYGEYKKKLSLGRIQIK